MSIDNKKSEFRQDIVSRDWILVAPKRENYAQKNLERKNSEKEEKTKEEIKKEIENCPFENPQKSGNGAAVLMFNKSGGRIAKSETETPKNWFLQIIPNKNPSLETDYAVCPKEEKTGPFSIISAVGFHEVVITRAHEKTIATFLPEEITVLLSAYKERYLELAKEKCLKYILIFHNNGKDAGASVPHSHSQIMALPIIPPDIARSLNGCNLYFEKQKKCPHCETLKWEMEIGERVIYKNSDFVAFCPYASHFNFEIRVFPLKHGANFEKITQKEIESLADIFKQTFGKIYEKLDNPSYNFFIHTAPINYIYDYHWHIEIIPRLSTWGGMELGTGIDVIVVSPEKAAAILK